MGAVDAFIDAIEEAIRPDERVSIAEWAERYRILPPDSPEPGPWRNERTPYLVAIMDALSPGSPYREVWLMKGVQLGGSALGENFVGHSICCAAGNILGVFPTLDDSDKWNLSRFEPMRESTRALRRRIRDRNVKGADNTQRRKRYPGGFMQLVGANRAGGLKSSTIRYIFFEECDEYDVDLDKQGDPIDLARNRASNFQRKARIFGNSTPTIEGRSHIERQHARGDQQRYMVPCPHCGRHQWFDWKQMSWGDDPSTPQLVCISCGALAPEHAWKAGMTLERAFWQATAVGEPGIASYHLSSLYAPLGWRPWSSMVADWLTAQGAPIKLKRFVNNELAELWQEQTDRLKPSVLEARAEDYALRTIPTGYMVLTLGVDVQDNRLALALIGWGRNERSAVLDYVELPGDPGIDSEAAGSPWAELDKYRARPLRNAYGADIRISMTAIDTGGHHTHAVYNYCRLRRHDRVIAVQGSATVKAILGKQTKQDVKNAKGELMKRGVSLWFVGVNAAKSALFMRIDNDADQPDRPPRLAVERLVRFSKHLPKEFFEMMTAEVFDEDKGRWVKLSGRRNEALDCYVYAHAAACHPTIRIHAMRDADWAHLEEYLQPAINDLFVMRHNPVASSAEAATDQFVGPPPPTDDVPRETPDPAASGVFVAPAEPPAPVNKFTGRESWLGRGNRDDV